MTTTELQVKIDQLTLSVEQSNELTKKYEGEITDLKKKLKDLNKPKLTMKQFDEVYQAIVQGVEEFDFDDQDNYETDFHIDYDNRIAIESMSFHNADELLRVVYNEARELFAEIKEDDNQENQN